MTRYPGIISRAVCVAPDMQEEPIYFCPTCGAQLTGGDTLAENKDGDTVGCCYCIRYYETWEKEL